MFVLVLLVEQEPQLKLMLMWQMLMMLVLGIVHIVGMPDEEREDKAKIVAQESVVGIVSVDMEELCQLDPDHMVAVGRTDSGFDSDSPLR